ncbi:hypothetical protein [Flexistipes sp.]|uniref:hypothetical protein n=1 Tax=Flexistipes sp. TaxID=3088135 RepID=UPI002E20D9F5|nr:hypothetical protein [Flexistipes sp.]
MSKYSSQTPTPTLAHTYDDKQYSTTQLLNRPFDDQLEFDENGKITSETKFKINSLTFNVYPVRCRRQSAELIFNMGSKG